jgi:hypothetical protein
MSETKVKYHYLSYPIFAQEGSDNVPADFKIAGFLTIISPSHAGQCWPAAASIGNTLCCGSFAVAFHTYIPTGAEILAIFKETNTALLHLYTRNERYGVANPLQKAVASANLEHPEIATVEIVLAEKHNYVLQLHVHDIPAWTELITMQ